MIIIFKIGQLANIFKISCKTLRYYDELDLLKPEYIDEETGYRFYTSSQILILNEILLLKEIGLSLKEISFFLSCEKNGYMSLLKLLDLRKIQIGEEIEALKQKLKFISTLGNTIKERKELKPFAYKVQRKKVEAIHVASIKTVISNYTDQGHLWKELLEFLYNNNIKVHSERFTIYYDSVFKDDEIEIEIVKRVQKSFEGNERIKYKYYPAIDTVACIVHKGKHSSVINSYEILFDWIENNNYLVDGPIREKYHQDDFTTDIPNDYVTEIQIPIKKVKEIKND